MTARKKARHGARESSRSVGQLIASISLTVLMVAALALAAAVTVVPRVIGAVPLTVLTGSMRPTIEPGDLIVVRPVDPAALSVGDVVTFQPVSGDPTLVTHRIMALHHTGGELTSLVTRGDANGADDAPIVPDQVMGRHLYTVPLIGHLTLDGRGPFAVGAVIGVGLIGYALVVLIKPEKKDDGEGLEDPAPPLVPRSAQDDELGAGPGFVDIESLTLSVPVKETTHA